MICLGIDTSNYTTSAALYDSKKNIVKSVKKLLPVKKGEKGIRQSDAVFHHTVQLPDILQNLFENFGGTVEKVGVSVSPRDEKGSYMPCFLTGISVAKAVAISSGVPIYSFSHQQGHIASVLYSSDRFDLFNKRFIAFHISGGTTEAVMVTPDDDNVFSTDLIFSSSDLKAGQAVDRVGIMLGMDFPCGKELDKLSRTSNSSFKIKTSFCENTFSLSGIENKCRKMIEENAEKSDIAKYCIDYISASLEEATKKLLSEYGDLPLVYSGGVMSNSLIRERFSKEFGAIFAEPEYSTDNADGIAVLASLRGENK